MYPTPTYRTRLNLNRLDNRTTPTTVTWDGGAGTLNWTDAKNWSTDTLPGSGDDVTVSGATGTVKYAGGATTISSLSVSNNLNLTAGSLTVSGKLTASPVTISASNAGVAFAANGSNSNIDGASLTASNGASISLPGVSTINWPANTYPQINATGVGSSIVLGNVTSLSVASVSPGGTPPGFQSTGSSTLTLSKLASITGTTNGRFQIICNSQISAPVLTSIALQPGTATIQLNGKLDVPALVSLDGVQLSFGPTGSMPYTQIQKITNGGIVAITQTLNFAGLTDFDGSSALPGLQANITLPALTTYAPSVMYATANFYSDGGGQLNLPNLTTLQGASYYYIILRATNGGTVNVPALTATTAATGGVIELDAEGAGSAINAPVYASMDDTNTVGGYFSAVNGGKVTTAANLAINYVAVVRDAASAFSFTTLNADRNSAIQIAGTIAADITDAGTVFLQTSSVGGGTTNITGNLTLSTTSTLDVKIYGTTPGTQYGQLTASGTVVVAGRAEIEYLGSPAFTPALGNSFQFVSGGSETGWFSNFIFNNKTPGVELVPAYAPTNVSFVAVVPGALRVTAQSPSGTVNAATSAVDLTFNEPVQLSNFAGGGVSLTGPGGPVTISSFTLVGPETYRLNFTTLTLPGTYTVKAGPAITDCGGTPMDQNQNGTPGENPGDVYTGTFNLSTSSPPVVSSVVINGGAAQRSRVTALMVGFDQHVTLPANAASAFQLKRNSDSAAVTLAATVDDTGPGTVVNFTFAGGAVDNMSLADGRYTLTVLASQVSAGNIPLDGNGDGAGGDDYVLVGDPATNKLFRLFGDIDGNGAVNSADFLAFRSAFGGSSFAFDFNNSGTVDAADFLAFRSRFGASV